MTTTYQVPPLTTAEEELVGWINASWTRDRALSTLKSSLQTAVEVELATIPIYLFTYYSINRTPGKATPTKPDAFPKTALSRFADRAGALIMSVAVEEMLHLSLSSNVLYALGEDPQIYGKSPDLYPARLPGHEQGTLDRDKPIPLARFSFDQLSHFLAIEYPAASDAPPEGGNWETIGQIYSYVRCIISSDLICDSDFTVRGAAEAANQIQSTEFSPNSIDTVYPTEAFDFVAPPAAPVNGSAATVAEFGSDQDSHVGATELLAVTSCEEALEAIATICFQGEGFAHSKYDDDSKDELSHYYKFLTLQSELDGYTRAYRSAGDNNVAPLPVAPEPSATQYDAADLATFVFPAPTNPVASSFLQGRDQLVDIADGLYQYMLIMTETIFRVPADKQKIYFNRTMHQSMIWILDKLLQSMREIETVDGNNTLCATFANYDLGDRSDAFANLTKLVKDFEADNSGQVWYKAWGGSYLLKSILELPDVSVYWSGPQPPPNPAYLDEPTTNQGVGTSPTPRTPPVTIFQGGKYAGTPKWPLTPPQDEELPVGAVRHSCMGLNQCKNQGRTSSNDCAGQGYCGTALAYNPENPAAPKFENHSCHVLNDCRGQGGCGLYGTADELANPGNNECQSKGSCATPINAERFITDGPLRGRSVWMLARAVFTKEVWPGLVAADPELPASPPHVQGSTNNPNLFQYGPTVGWMENDNGGEGMTACGASGMSGAGSCA